MTSWELEMILVRLEKIRLQIDEELLSIGEGSLSFQNKSGKYFYREYNNYMQKGITKDEKRIYQLARKEYLIKKLKRIEKEIILLSRTKGRIEAINDAVDMAVFIRNTKCLISKS